MANPYAAYTLPTPDAPLALPDINPGVETLRFAAGVIIRSCLHATVYYGGRGWFEERVQKKEGAATRREGEAMRYLFSGGTELALSLLWQPKKYLAAVTTPRFLFDYMMTRWSDCLSMLDAFRPGRFASYAVHAFMSNASDEEWNLDFFAWQVPSVVLTVAKLITRRRRLGAAKCRTKRVLGMLLLQVLLRAYVTTFSVMIPETGEQALEAICVTLLEGVTSSYLTRHTWPFPPRDEGQASANAPATRTAPMRTPDYQDVKPLRHPSQRPTANTPAATPEPTARRAAKQSNPNTLD